MPGRAPQVIEKMVELVGIEPTTSSLTGEDAIGERTNVAMRSKAQNREVDLLQVSCRVKLKSAH